MTLQKREVPAELVVRAPSRSAAAAARGRGSVDIMVEGVA